MSKRERHERKVAAKEERTGTGYRRRRSVIWRPSQLGIPRQARFGWFWFPEWVNDGGNDAPLSPHGRTIFRVALIVIVALGVGLLLLTRLGG